MASLDVKCADQSSKVYKEECMYCFHNPETAGGLYVCLRTFYGLCPRHLELHVSKSGSQHYANCVRVRRKKVKEPTTGPDSVAAGGQPDEKVSKLAIGVEGGFSLEDQQYDFEDTWTYVKVPNVSAKVPLTDPALDGAIKAAIDAILAAESAYRLQELESLAGTWDGSFRAPTKHVDLDQIPNPPAIPPSGWACQVPGCDNKDNLWLNLTDGSIFCGRKYFDGTGGNNHALEYYALKKFPLAVKLGTITAHSADVYSYDEDDMVENPNLAKQLKHFGINMMDMEKTEKTMLELELDLNQKYEWSAIQEEGHKLQPLHGPGFTGMLNLGSSCYINSSIQTLCLIPGFVERYCNEALRTYASTPGNPADNFIVQLCKVITGLQSGDYSLPPAEEEHEEVKTGGDAAMPPPDAITTKICEPPTNHGFKPLAFRTLVGRGHQEFSSKRQQDAEEYLRHLFDLVEKNTTAANSNPVEPLKFELEQRTQCGSSGHVTYVRSDEVILSVPVAMDAVTNKEAVAAFEVAKKETEDRKERILPENIVRPKIPLEACFAKWAGQHTIDDFYSSAVKAKTSAIRSTKLASFPDYLLVQLKKFIFKDDWTPFKLDIELEFPPDHIVDLAGLRGKGAQPGEVIMAEESDGGEADSRPAAPVIDEAVVAQLKDMGFPDAACRKAVARTGNSGLEPATNWVMEHMGDPDFADPDPEFQESMDTSAPLPGSGGAPAPDESLVANLTMLGFTGPQAKKALRECMNNVEQAAEWLFMNPDDPGDLDVVPLPARAPPTAAAGSIPTQTQQSSAPTNRFRDGSERYQLVGFISHMGSSTQCGHYVCHLLKEGRWVMFNDEKVALSEKPPFGLGYVYLFKRL